MTELRATNPNDPDTCRGCGAPIFWRYTPNMARMPLNVESIGERSRGVYILVGDRNCRPASMGPETYPGPYFMNHWATCPKTAIFKKDRTNGN